MAVFCAGMLVGGVVAVIVSWCLASKEIEYLRREEQRSFNRCTKHQNGERELWKRIQKAREALDDSASE